MPYAGLPKDAVVFSGLPEGATIIDNGEKPYAPEEITPEWAGKHPDLYGAVMAARNTLGPLVEAGGMAGGGALGASAGPVGAVGGAGLGYAASKQFLDAIDQAIGTKQATTIPQAAGEAAKDVVAGSAMEAGGQVAGKAIGKGIEVAGKGVKELLGATTGSGPGTMEEALKGGKSFRDAMRGKVTGDEIVDNAASALQSLKEQRATQYTTQLSGISKNKEPIDMTPIKDKMGKLLKQYGVKVADPSTMVNTGEMYDFSRSVFGKSARRDVKEIADLVDQWGTKEGDNTPLMLDTLKRRLDDFYSDSSQARQLVTAIRNTVKDSIVKQVPQYEKMTKGYSEASNLIKDVESNLMLRKNGMSGRITADQTLRRLTSSMRENFEMRRDLVNILGEKSGQDLSGQIAGYSASQIMPRGLVGKLAGGSAGYLVYLNPKFWPMLAASSPRVAGEFLNVYGKGLVHAKVISPATYRTIAFETGKAIRNMSDDEKQKYITDLYQKSQGVQE